MKTNDITNYIIWRVIKRIRRGETYLSTTKKYGISRYNIKILVVLYEECENLKDIERKTPDVKECNRKRTRSEYYMKYQQRHIYNARRHRADIKNDRHIVGNIS